MTCDKNLSVMFESFKLIKALNVIRRPENKKKANKDLVGVQEKLLLEIAALL